MATETVTEAVAPPPQAQTEMVIGWRIMMGERYFIRHICLIRKLLVLSTNLDERRKNIRSVSKWPNASMMPSVGWNPFWMEVIRRKQCLHLVNRKFEW